MGHDFCFATDEALELVKKENYDDVISDMMMPKMNGAKLLKEIRNLHPDTVRIILSGYSDMEMALRSVGITHQYLSKPCNPEELKIVLSGAFTLRNILKDEKLRGIVTGLKNIPSIPSIFKELMELVKSGNSTARQISEIISQIFTFNSEPALNTISLTSMAAHFIFQTSEVSSAMGKK